MRCGPVAACSRASSNVARTAAVTAHSGSSGARVRTADARRATAGSARRGSDGRESDILATVHPHAARDHVDLAALTSDAHSAPRGKDGGAAGAAAKARERRASTRSCLRPFPLACTRESDAGSYRLILSMTSAGARSGPPGHSRCGDGPPGASGWVDGHRGAVVSPGSGSSGTVHEGVREIVVETNRSPNTTTDRNRNDSARSGSRHPVRVEQPGATPPAGTTRESNQRPSGGR